VEISSERLAYWFLRLNGFLTIYNFIVHPEEADLRGGYPQQTDVDVMGAAAGADAAHHARVMSSPARAWEGRAQGNSKMPR
jgi:hypothetical protein